MNNKGFSLIEIIITVALIAMIASFSLVTYQTPLLKMKQAAAKLELLLIAEEIEQFYSLHQNYQGISLESLGYVVKTSDYHITIHSATAQSYQLAAIPKKENREDECGIFYLDQNGNKTISGNGSIDECW